MSDATAVRDALAQLREGRFVALRHDDPGADAYLCMAASLVTPDAINFLAKEARGIVCLALTAERCWQLGLREMVRSRPEPPGHMVTIEARDGVTTGISAHDRARTILAAVGPGGGRHAIVSPGHVLPIQARPGGVLAAPGHAEAAVDLVALSGLPAAAVTSAIMNDDGSMVRGREVDAYARRHDILPLPIRELVAYREALGFGTREGRLGGRPQSASDTAGNAVETARRG